MIEKSICLPGNIFVVNNKVSVDNTVMGVENNGLHTMSASNWNIEIPVGTKIQIVKKPTSTVSFKIDGGSTIFTSYWSAFKFKVDKIEGQEIVEPIGEVLRYKIYYNGKPYKVKYFSDLGKVKSSLLISFGYYNEQYEMFEKYKDRNPELQDNEIPEWFSGGKDFTREQCANIEIMSFAGKSRNPIKIDFDVTNYYDQSMKLIDVTAKFGSAARELYKKTMQSGEYSYLLVYAPDEYRDEKNFSTSYGYRYSTFDYSSLKESQKIKDVLKASGVKDTKKCTKFGKTAIVFKNMDDLKQVMLRLETQEYFILDCDGDQLVEKNTRFVKLIMLQEAAREQE